MKWICVKETKEYQLNQIVDDADIWFIRGSFRMPVMANWGDDPEIKKQNDINMAWNNAQPKFITNKYDFANDENFISLSEYRNNRINEILE